MCMDRRPSLIVRAERLVHYYGQKDCINDANCKLQCIMHSFLRAKAYPMNSSMEMENGNELK